MAQNSFNILDHVFLTAVTLLICCIMLFLGSLALKGCDSAISWYKQHRKGEVMETVMITPESEGVRPIDKDKDWYSWGGIECEKPTRVRFAPGMKFILVPGGNLNAGGGSLDLADSLLVIGKTDLINAK